LVKYSCIENNLDELLQLGSQDIEDNKKEELEVLEEEIRRSLAMKISLF